MKSDDYLVVFCEVNMNYCKYKLPCGRCEKLNGNKFCDLLHSSAKRICEDDKHKWKHTKTQHYIDGRFNVYSICSICGAEKIEYFDLFGTLMRSSISTDEF